MKSQKITSGHSRCHIYCSNDLKIGQNVGTLEVTFLAQLPEMGQIGSLKWVKLIGSSEVIKYVTGSNYKNVFFCALEVTLFALLTLKLFRMFV